MNLRLRNLLVFFGLMAAISNSSAQSVVMMMKVPALTGESTLDDYEGWCEILSASFTASRAAGAPSAQTGGIQLTRVADSLSPIFFSNVVQGSSLGVPADPVKIHYLKMVGNVRKPFMEIALEGTRFESISHSSGGEVPQEALSMTVTKMTVTTRVYMPNGLEDVSKRQTFTYTFAP